MFVQAFKGRLADGEGLRRQLERWMTELRPGAKGFLGSTTGVTDGGEAIGFARFESKAEAMANSESAEQGQWRAATEECFDGEVQFHESEEIDNFLAGGSNDAGFVQIMRGHGADRERLHALDEQLAKHAASFRPDLIGGFRMWTAKDSYIEVAYFTNEAEARAGESKPPPADFAEQMADFEQLMANVEFIDIHDPWLF